MIKKITIDQLKPGMYIADLNNQWVPSQNASRRGLIPSQAVVEKIRQLGVRELYIDTNKGADCPEVQGDAVKQLQSEQFQSIAEQSGTAIQDRPVIDSKHYEQAAKSYHRARGVIGRLLEDVKSGHAIDAAAVEDTAEELISSMTISDSALACLSFIREKDAYLLEHSINVGILLGIFARSRAIGGDVLRQLVAGGLLHDIGKILVPRSILDKPGKLDDEEWEEMKRHVTYGEQILDVTAGLPEITRSICRLHHERLDGTGYPRGLSGQDISLYGRMSAICDVYDAITADRVYHHGMPPNLAMRKLIEWSVFHLDKELVYDFIRCMSPYPVGTVVGLSNGQAGVVIKANHSEPKKPSVRLFWSLAEEAAIEPRVVDLGADASKLTIISTLDARQVGVDIRPYL